MTDRYWYKEPGCLRIKVEPHEIRKHWFDHDTLIVKEIEGKEWSALIPTHTLSENRDSAPVILAGRKENDVILYFPVSNEGRDVWCIPEAEFDKIRVNG